MIDIKNLNKTYDRRRAGENQVLHDISFTLPDTGFVCILGPSGCGKTSLLNAIGGLDEFDNGTITVDGVTVNRYGTALYEAERNRSFGYIFQNYYLLPDHSVGYNVYLGLHSLKLSHDEKIKRVKEALAAVEMDRYIRRNVGELSGGQQQRVAIARALARKPRVIFADEPTGNLDEANTLNICSLLRNVSKSSLVIMVTHEERIANFFADRIITLDNGRINSDNQSWERSSLSVGSVKSLYTGEYAQTDLEADNVSLRVFQEEGIEPVKISIVALKDRIVIKLDDHRAVSCGATMDTPSLIEGPWPMLTLEEVERKSSEQQLIPNSGENISAKPGSGITFSDMFREARHMGHGKKLRGFGTKLFLVLLAVLLSLSVADFVTIFNLEPEDFITAHSEALEVVIMRGPRAGSSTDTLQTNSRKFKFAMEDAVDMDFVCVPDISYNATVSGNLILQADSIAVTLDDCSFTPVSYLDDTTLIMGHLPEDPSQAVIDRWVLDAVMAEDGVAQNSITSIDYFLGKQIRFGTLNAAPTIVGICDSGQPAVYMSNEMLASVGTSGTEVMALSTFKANYPGQYDDIELASDECIVLPANAGEIFWDSLNGEFTTVCGSTFTIVEISDVDDCYAKVIVSDSQIDDMMLNMALKRFWVYCDDKDAMTEQLMKLSRRYDDQIDVTVTDIYAETMAQYEEASRLRADSRTIVTATVMLLSAVMLYLLRRADVYSRIGMLSVYRLLGAPVSKSVGIFCIESILSSLTTVLPTVAAVWVVLGVLKANDVTDMIFPWYAALLVVVGILCFQLAVTIIPMRRLMKLPPAQLAAKYDF